VIVKLGVSCSLFVDLLSINWEASDCKYTSMRSSDPTLQWRSIAYDAVNTAADMPQLFASTRCCCCAKYVAIKKGA
jgi:hypothetical protein